MVTVPGPRSALANLPGKQGMSAAVDEY